MATKKTKENAKAADGATVNGDFSYVSAKDGKTYKLTIKEKLFCEYYLQFYGNGVDAVYEAGYKVKDRKVAAQISHENLRKPNLIAYIDSLLVEYGFTDDNVEKQHLFVLNQFDDLRAKNTAIEMFYKLKGKFAPEKHEHDVGQTLADLIASANDRRKKNSAAARKVQK